MKIKWSQWSDTSSHFYTISYTFLAKTTLQQIKYHPNADRNYKRKQFDIFAPLMTMQTVWIWQVRFACFPSHQHQRSFGLKQRRRLTLHGVCESFFKTKTLAHWLVICFSWRLVKMSSHARPILVVFLHVRA